MPIGEDIPMLIPIGLILTILVLFILSLFIHMSDQNEITRMSQVSLDTIDYAANIIFSDNYGRLDYSAINSLGTKYSYKKLSNLNISSEYNMVLNISDTTSNEWWCWNNTKKQGSDIVLVNEVPFIIINGNNSDLGKVSISVSK